MTKHGKGDEAYATKSTVLLLRSFLRADRPRRLRGELVPGRRMLRPTARLGPL